MAVMTSSPPLRPSRALAGILCIEAGMLLFVVQDVLMKALLGDFTIWLLIVARACVTLVVLGPLIVMLGAPHRLLTPLWPLHLARAALFAIGFSLFYVAFPFMGLGGGDDDFLLRAADDGADRRALPRRENRRSSQRVPRRRLRWGVDRHEPDRRRVPMGRNLPADHRGDLCGVPGHSRARSATGRRR